MDSQVFRKKSVDKVKSPENLNEYIRVVNPSLWILLASIIILLAGICIWGALGTIETKTAVTGTILDGTAIFYADSDLTESVSERLESGDVVSFDYNGITGTVIACDKDNFLIYGVIEAESGVVTAYIEESIKPLSLLFN